MRSLNVIFVVALLLATPVLAQTSSSTPATSSNSNAPHNFGRIICPQPVECDGTSSAGLAAIANSCFTQYFGYSSPSGFFDDSVGLSGSNCLAVKSDAALPKGMGAQLVPQCCVVTTQPNVCNLRCELVTGS